MKKHSNAPQIRFQNFEAEWLDSTIGRHITLLNGRAYKQEELLDEGKYRVLRVGNFNTNSKWYYSNLELEENKYVNKGDLLYLWATNFGPEIWTEEKAIYHYHIWKLEFDRTEINQDYLNIWLESDKNKIQQNTNGSTMVHITKTMMEERGISLPNFDEQSAIGSLFRTLDDLLVSYKDNLTNYQSLKAVMLSKMFPKAGQTVPEIRLDGFEGEWEEKKLGEIVDIVGGGTPDTNVKEYWNGEINWFSPTEVGNSIYLDTSEKRISELGLQKSSAKILPANRTILFTSRAGIGSVGIITKDSTTNQGFQSLVIKEGIDIYFLFSYSSEITRYALKHSAGSTFLEISGKELGKMDIIIPTLKEQQAIGAYFSNLDQLISSHQDKITQLETLKKKLLQDMFI
ncbi:restriction endonuclease subunit S [Streptococcus sp. Marseille-Q6504]|jgi:restriction modification system DNA specificity domain protein